MRQAIGIIETLGLAAGLEAADTVVKAANVSLIGYEKTKGGGWVAIKFSGDVGAVKAALAAGVAAASKVNKVISTLVLARPHESLEPLIYTNENFPQSGQGKGDGVGGGDGDGDCDGGGEDLAAQADQADQVDQSCQECQGGQDDQVCQAGQECLADQECQEGQAEQTNQAEQKEQIDKVAQTDQTAQTDETSRADQANQANQASQAEEQTEDTGARINGRPYTCNLCQNPDCPRGKGDARTNCIFPGEWKR